MEIQHKTLEWAKASIMYGAKASYFIESRELEGWSLEEQIEACVRDVRALDEIDKSDIIIPCLVSNGILIFVVNYNT